MPERSEVRYRLAQLLMVEKFEEALNDAIVAYSQGKIIEADLRFVVEIVKSAERAGRSHYLKVRIPSPYLPREEQSQDSKRQVVIRILGEINHEIV